MFRAEVTMRQPLPSRGGQRIGTAAKVNDKERPHLLGCNQGNQSELSFTGGLSRGEEGEGREQRFGWGGRAGEGVLYNRKSAGLRVRNPGTRSLFCNLLATNY